MERRWTTSGHASSSWSTSPGRGAGLGWDPGIAADVEGTYGVPGMEETIGTSSPTVSPTSWPPENFPRTFATCAAISCAAGPPIGGLSHPDPGSRRRRRPREDDFDNYLPATSRGFDCSPL